MNTRTQSKQQKEKCYLAAACILLVALACLYMYFLSMSVVHVVMRKEIDTDKNALHSDISTLESQYIKRQHSMTKEIASLDGFVSTEEKIFIHRSDTNLVLSTNTTR